MAIELVSHKAASRVCKSIALCEIYGLRESLEERFALFLRQSHAHNSDVEVAGMRVTLLEFDGDTLHSIMLHRFTHYAEHYFSQCFRIGREGERL